MLYVHLLVTSVFMYCYGYYLYRQRDFDGAFLASSVAMSLLLIRIIIQTYAGLYYGN
jgi:cytochrome bd-type quinol oxidase subunit 1